MSEMENLRRLLALLDDGLLINVRAQRDVAAAVRDLQAAVLYAVSPHFPAPNSDADRIAWLRTWAHGRGLL